MPRPRVRVDSVVIDPVTLAEAVHRITDFARTGTPPRHVCTCNVDHLVWLSRDADFAAAYDAADLVVADGAPIVWLSRIAAPSRAAALPGRVAGVDLFWELVKASHEEGLRLFLLGGMPGAAERAAGHVRTAWPRANICGMYCPPRALFDTPEEQARIREAVRVAAPHVLFVALGAPKQEKWIHANKHELNVPVSVGIGGTFELASGGLRRAPRWMQRAGLEWAYRVGQEPRRLFSRYFIDDAPYLAGAVLRAIAQRRKATRTDET